MAVIKIKTRIAAPPERVFDLARNIDFHVDTQTRHRERAVPGPAPDGSPGIVTGLIGPGESVTWEAVHFGVRQRLTSRLGPEYYDRPRRFRDSMVPGSGAFAGFDHDHIFEIDPVAKHITVRIDVFDLRAPFGVFGRLAERLFLTAYMRRLLLERADLIRTTAESEEWRQYL